MAFTRPQHGVALLGAGIFAKSAHLPALAQTPSLTLKAVYSRSQSSADSLAEAAKAFPSTAGQLDVYFDSPAASETGLDALFARTDIQTVILSLPIPAQAAVIERAWKAGKNVVSEKPVAKDVEEARRLLEVYKAYKGKVMWIIAEQFPYEPAYTFAKDLLAEGRIGELRSFSLEFYNFVEKGSKYYETPWRKDPTYQGGFLLDGGVHFVAGLRHMLPASAALTSLSATSSLLQPHLPPADTLHGILSTASSLPGTFVIAFGIESSSRRMYTFRGSHGTLEVDFSTRDIVVTLTPKAGAPEVTTHPGRGVEEEFLAFGDALVRGPGSAAALWVEERSGPRAALCDLAVIQGALKSAQTGKRVELALLRGDVRA